MGFPWWLSGKESACQCRKRKRHRLHSGVGKIPWRRKWQPMPVFLPGNPMDKEVWQATVHGVTKSWTHSQWVNSHPFRQKWCSRKKCQSLIYAARMDSYQYPKVSRLCGVSQHVQGKTVTTVSPPFSMMDSGVSVQCRFSSWNRTWVLGFGPDHPAQPPDSEGEAAWRPMKGTDLVEVPRGLVAEQESVSPVAQSGLTLYDPLACSTPGLPVHHQLPELAQTHVHWAGDAIQPSYPLSSPSPPTFNLS